MSAWLYSIIGIVFLGVLVDILYPNGKTNTFCKSIFGIIAVVIMLNPILKYNPNKQNIENTYYNSKLNSAIQKSKDSINENIIINHLKNIGIEGISVEIDSIMQNDEYVIENILVDASQVVLNQDMEHTYMYKVILENVTNALQIESEKVIIYG